MVVSPHNRNLLFAMTQFGSVFSVASFAAMYFENPSRAGAADALAGSASEVASAERALPKSALGRHGGQGGPSLFGGVDLRELQISEELRRQLSASEKEQERASKDKTDAKDGKEGDGALLTKALSQMQRDSVHVQQELFELALWGDFYRDPETNAITTKPPHPVGALPFERLVGKSV